MSQITISSDSPAEYNVLPSEEIARVYALKEERLLGFRGFTKLKKARAKIFNFMVICEKRKLPKNDPIHFCPIEIGRIEITLAEVHVGKAGPLETAVGHPGEGKVSPRYGNVRKVTPADQDIERIEQGDGIGTCDPDFRGCFGFLNGLPKDLLKMGKALDHLNEKGNNGWFGLDVLLVEKGRLADFIFSQLAQLVKEDHGHKVLHDGLVDERDLVPVSSVRDPRQRKTKPSIAWVKEAGPDIRIVVFHPVGSPLSDH